MVAVVQCVEDRGHVLLAPRRDRVRLDVASVVDQFSHAYQRNACHGGRPEDVVDCLATGTCRLYQASPASRWRGHPRPTRVSRLPSNVPYSVAGYTTPRTVDDVKRHVYEDGPVVLLTNADTLKAVDSRGVATDPTPRPINHSVSVVGWTDDGHWIVRNSWGRHRVPKAVPVDMRCVSFDANACEVEWEPWTGDPDDPGFLYLPIHHASLHPPHPSPWIVPHVR